MENLMIAFTKYITLLMGILFIGYLAFAFINADFNFKNWEMISRQVLIVLSFVFTFAKIMLDYLNGKSY